MLGPENTLISLTTFCSSGLLADVYIASPAEIFGMVSLELK